MIGPDKLAENAGEPIGTTGAIEALDIPPSEEEALISSPLESTEPQISTQEGSNPIEIELVTESVPSDLIPSVDGPLDTPPPLVAENAGEPIGTTGALDILPSEEEALISSPLESTEPQISTQEGSNPIELELVTESVPSDLIPSVDGPALDTPPPLVDEFDNPLTLTTGLYPTPDELTSSESKSESKSELLPPYRRGPVFFPVGAESQSPIQEDVPYSGGSIEFIDVRPIEFIDMSSAKNSMTPAPESIEEPASSAETPTNTPASSRAPSFIQNAVKTLIARPVSLAISFAIGAGVLLSGAALPIAFISVVTAYAGLEVARRVREAVAKKHYDDAVKEGWVDGATNQLVPGRLHSSRTLEVQRGLEAQTSWTKYALDDTFKAPKTFIPSLILQASADYQVGRELKRRELEAANAPTVDQSAEHTGSSCCNKKR